MKPREFRWNLVVVLAVLVLSAGIAAAGLTRQDSARLKLAGLSEPTIAEMEALHLDEGRRRSPAVGVGDVEKMRLAGFEDDLIRLFAKLDRLTGDLDSVPVSPAQALDLVKSGASLQTVWLMVGSEIERVAGPPPAAGAGEEAEKPALGREVVIKPDGRKVIVYRSGKATQPVEEVTHDADGKKVLVYRSGGSDKPEPSIDLAQQQAIQNALEKLQIYVHVFRRR